MSQTAFFLFGLIKRLVLAPPVATGWEVGKMMTDAQKKMIAGMRGLGAGYTEVAKQLDLPVGTIKTYCRRNGLTGDPRDTQLKKKSRNTQKNDLIDIGNIYSAGCFLLWKNKRCYFSALILYYHARIQYAIHVPMRYRPSL